MMIIDNYFGVLKKMSLFKGFSDEKLINLFKSIDYKLSRYDKEAIVFLENEECNTFDIILKGSIQIQEIDSFGRVLTIAEFYEGETLGENLIFGNNNTYPMAAMSKRDTLILHIHKNSVLRLCQEDSLFLMEFLKLLSGKTLTLSRRIKQVTLKTIREKICELVVEKYETQNDLSIDLGMSRKEWAEKIGVQRPSLSRELIKMKEEGLIDYTRDSIYIKNLKSIKEYI